MSNTATYQDILCFWFEEATPKEWFSKELVFNETIRTQFSKLHAQATAGE